MPMSALSSLCRAQGYTEYGGEDAGQWDYGCWVVGIIRRSSPSSWSGSPMRLRLVGEDSGHRDGLVAAGSCT